jgi:hypothetical protein
MQQPCPAAAAPPCNPAKHATGGSTAASRSVTATSQVMSRHKTHQPPHAAAAAAHHAMRELRSLGKHLARQVRHRHNTALHSSSCPARRGNFKMSAAPRTGCCPCASAALLRPVALLLLLLLPLPPLLLSWPLLPPLQPQQQQQPCSSSTQPGHVTSDANL